MAGKRKVYTPEFKLQAVKMITEQKLSVAEVARRLGVTENRLHEWKKAVLRKGADAFPGSGHLTPVEEELRRLRAEVKRLEAERDILKKPRRSSPPRRTDLRLDRGTQGRLAGGAALPRPGGVPLGVLRLAVPRAQRRRGPAGGVGRADHDDPRRGEGPLRQPADPRRVGGPGYGVLP